MCVTYSLVPRMAHRFGFSPEAKNRIGLVVHEPAYVSKDILLRPLLYLLAGILGFLAFGAYMVGAMFLFQAFTGIDMGFRW